MRKLLSGMVASVAASMGVILDPSILQKSKGPGLRKEKSYRVTASKYRPHQGAQEQQRRKSQIERGILKLN